MSKKVKVSVKPSDVLKALNIISADYLSSKEMEVIIEAELIETEPADKHCPCNGPYTCAEHMGKYRQLCVWL